MDADDVAQPDRLGKQVAFLDANPQVGLVGGQILRMGARGAGMPSNLPTAHAEIVDDLLANRHGMCNATTMFRRKLFEQVGGYWEHNLSEDWDLFLRMAEVAELANLDDLLMAVRFHSGSLNGHSGHFILKINQRGILLVFDLFFGSGQQFYRLDFCLFSNLVL